MIMSLVAIVIVLVIAYIWSARGFFSSLLHMVCVIVAGAIAFAFWEPLAYLILDKVNKQWIENIVWGVSLLLPFAASLALLRVAVDKAIPGNADLDNISNLVGGGVCGLVSGTITAGILVLSIGFLRLPAEFLQYRPLTYDNNGNLVRTEGLIFPADRITAGIYGRLSETALRTGDPMGTWRPDLADQGPLLRTNFNEGSSRITVQPDAFKVLGRYTVGRGQSITPRDLLAYSIRISDDNRAARTEDRTQTLVDADGESPGPGSYIEGYVLQFGPGAREKRGQVIAGRGQLSLTVRSADDTHSRSVQPTSIIALSPIQGDSEANPVPWRWPYNSGEVYFASIGGNTEAPMAFEFLVPNGYRPIALNVKGVRTDIPEPAAKEFESGPQRDAAARSGVESLVGGASATAALIANLDRSSAAVVPPVSVTGPAPVTLTNRLPGVMQRGQTKGLEEENRRIVNGEDRFTSEELNVRGIDSNLRVSSFAPGEGTSMVQVVVGGNTPLSLVTSSAADKADKSKPPVLIDEAGNVYQAVGFVYKDQTLTHIRYTLGSPLPSISDLPFSLSVSRPDQELTLLFCVTIGAKVQYFAIGETVIGEVRPTLSVTGGQR